MTLTAALAAVSIAFPRENQMTPALVRCYAIGSTTGGETNVVVQGRNVPVHRTGAWAALLDVVPGTNVVTVGGTTRTFVVAAPDPQEARRPPRTYVKLPYAADEARPHPAGRAPSAVTVVLDAGHGGSDTGAVSPHDLKEKDANLLLAKATEKALKARGFNVVMTRTDDSFPALYDRPKVAHAAKADAFVSIHHNAPAYDKHPGSVRFQAVYAWNGLGERLAEAIARRMGRARPALPNKGVIHANFAVTRNPEIPSCLVEADFVTHPDGEHDVWDPDCRATAANAIADGIADWVAGTAKPE